MNGISEVATRADLLSRALLVDLPVIENFREKKAVMAEFEERRPAILGALFDAMVTGLKNLPTEDPLHGERPRIADAARWAVACDKALGLKKGAFVEALTVSREEATKTALESEPIWRSLYELAKKHPEGESSSWKGNMKKLLADLNDMEEDNSLKRSKDLPKTERKLSAILKTLEPALRELGIYVWKLSGSRREGRLYELFYRKPPEKD